MGRLGIDVIEKEAQKVCKKAEILCFLFGKDDEKMNYIGKI